MLKKGKRRKKQGDCNNNTLTLTKEKRQFLQIIEKIFNILCTFCTLKKQMKKSFKNLFSFNRISNLSLFIESSLYYIVIFKQICQADI